MFAFMAATGCYSANLRCIFWLVMVSSEPVSLYVKSLFFFFFHMHNFTFINSELLLSHNSPVSEDICVKTKTMLKCIPFTGLVWGPFFLCNFTKVIF